LRSAPNPDFTSIREKEKAYLFLVVTQLLEYTLGRSLLLERLLGARDSLDLVNTKRITGEGDTSATYFFQESETFFSVKLTKSRGMRYSLEGEVHLEMNGRVNENNSVNLSKKSSSEVSLTNENLDLVSLVRSSTELLETLLDDLGVDVTSLSLPVLGRFVESEDDVELIRFAGLDFCTFSNLSLSADSFSQRNG
jgi:hypothetical protein